MINKNLDSIIIGYNEVNIERTAESIKNDLLSYKRLSLDFIRKDRKLFSISDIFNKICQDNNLDISPINWGEVLTAVVPYLVTYLTKKGLTVGYVNDFQNDKDNLKDLLSSNNVKTVVITTTFYPSFSAVVEIITMVRSISPKTKVITGGAFIYNCIKSLSNNDLQNIFTIINSDYYVGNMEGEYCLSELIKSISVGEVHDELRANIYQKKEGSYQTSKLEKENNLIEENLVDWSLLKDDMSTYFSVRLSTSCPFSCSFCSFAHQQFKYLSTSDVEKNLQLLFNSCGNRNIHFTDDAFNVPKKRFKEFLEMLDRNKFNFKWTGLLRLQYFDEDIAELMQKTGCQSILLGIESGSQKILDLMNKKAKIEQYVEGIELLNKYNIASKASFLVGFPGETEETVKETYDFIEHCKPSFYYVNLWYNDVLSPIYSRKDEFGIKGRAFDWSHNTMNATRAMEHVDNLFLNVKNSTWLPLFNMDYLFPTHMMNKGFSLSKTKEFVSLFNKGTKEIIGDPNAKEISDETIYKMTQLLLNRN